MPRKTTSTPSRKAESLPSNSNNSHDNARAHTVEQYGPRLSHHHGPVAANTAASSRGLQIMAAGQVKVPCSSLLRPSGNPIQLTRACHGQFMRWSLRWLLSLSLVATSTGLGLRLLMAIIDDSDSSCYSGFDLISVIKRKQRTRY